MSWAWFISVWLSFEEKYWKRVLCHGSNETWHFCTTSWLMSRYIYSSAKSIVLLCLYWWILQIGSTVTLSHLCKFTLPCLQNLWGCFFSPLQMIHFCFAMPVIVQLLGASQHNDALVSLGTAVNKQTHTQTKEEAPQTVEVCILTWKLGLFVLPLFSTHSKSCKVCNLILPHYFNLFNWKDKTLKRTVKLTWWYVLQKFFFLLCPWLDYVWRKKTTTTIALHTSLWLDFGFW